LYDAGYDVIGCEGVEKACAEFFQENKMEFTKTETHPGFPVFAVMMENIGFVSKSQKTVLPRKPY
jgi:hypothetical protein